MHRKLACFSLMSALCLPSLSLATNADLSGQYIGYHRLTMNTIDAPALIKLQLPKTTLNGVDYMILGKSIGAPLWKWDFDAMTVTWGGDTLLAMKTQTPIYQPFSQEVISEKKSDEVLNITDVSEITMPITKNGDGTYTVNYALKIYIQMAGYPIGATSTTFQIEKNTDDTLSIQTIDFETDGKPLDGVPGTRITDVFPYTVQAQFDAQKMHPETGVDSNGDGISDLKAKLLGLDTIEADYDGDGYSDVDELGLLVKPKDSDQDGIANILEKGDTANNAKVLAGVQFDNSLSFNLQSADDLPFQLSHFSPYQHQLEVGQILSGQPLPTRDSNGQELTLWQLGFSHDSNDIGIKNKLNYRLTPNESMPEGITLWEKKITTKFASTEEVVSYVPLSLNFDEAAPNEVNLQLAHTLGQPTHKQLIFSLVKPEPVPEPDSEPTEPGSTSEPKLPLNPNVDTDANKANNSSSAGSTGLFGLIAVSAFIATMRRRKIKQQAAFKLL